MAEGKAAYREVEADLNVVRREVASDGVVTVTLAHPDGADLPKWNDSSFFKRFAKGGTH